jgi:polysaccharide biosynthesis protein PslG
MPEGMGRHIRNLFILPVTLLVVVTGVATSAAGNPSSPARQVPVNLSAPAISGSPTVGASQTATAGGWKGGALTYSYRWERCDAAGAACVAIPGGSSTSYTAATADVGSTLRISVTASNRNGSASASSAASGPIAAPAPPPPPPPPPTQPTPPPPPPPPSSPPVVTAPASTALPQLSGTTQAGQALTADTGSWSGQPTAYAYQWQRCNSTGSACANIAGATSTTYTLSSTDVGATLRATVTASNAGGSTAATSAASGTVAAAPGSPPSASGFGIAAGGDIQNYSATDLARYLDLLKAAHAGWVRFDINWNSIQYAGASSYDWKASDAVVNGANARGLHVLAALIYTPPWARPAGSSPTTPPTNLADYAAFAKVAAEHFAPLGVHDFEIWNEPNISDFWAPSPDPARYTSMLKLAYTAIKSADPASTVVSAGLSPYGSYGDVTTARINPLNFLQKMYASGAHGSMDGVGWHPYSFPARTEYAVWSAWSQMSETSPSARSIMTANGDAGAKIWATEYGAPTGTASASFTEAAQAQYVTEAITKFKTFSWAGPAFLYSGRDAGTDMSKIENAFGFIRNDWSLKPSYAAFSAAVQ